MISFETIWKRIEQHQGYKFQQIRGQEFTYKVISGAVMPSTTNQQLPRGHYEKAAELLPLEIRCLFNIYEAHHICTQY